MLERSPQTTEMAQPTTPRCSDWRIPHPSTNSRWSSRRQPHLRWRGRKVHYLLPHQHREDEPTGLMSALKLVTGCSAIAKRLSYAQFQPCRLVRQGNAPDFVEVGEAGNAVDDAMRRGKHIREGGVSPHDWLHFISSLLCHDIGYVRGVCSGDSQGQYVCNEQGDFIELANGATDASLAPYHVCRSKVFVRERFGQARVVHFDTLAIERNIEHTRFPVPLAISGTACGVGAHARRAAPAARPCDRRDRRRRHTLRAGSGDIPRRD